MLNGISVQDVSLDIADRTIFSDLSFDCDPGTTVALVGASGSGKTSLLNCLGLLQKPTRGRITIDGQDASQWKSAKQLAFWRKKAAFIYQDYGIIEDETVAYNVSLREKRIFSRSPYTDSELERTVQKVGLLDRLLDKAAVLSGGEKQRVGIARAMYKQAKYIFADEPTASLDEENRDAILNLFAQAKASGACIIMATHDTEVSRQADVLIELTQQRAGVQRLTV